MTLRSRSTGRLTVRTSRYHPMIFVKNRLPYAYGKATFSVAPAARCEKENAHGTDVMTSHVHCTTCIIKNVPKRRVSHPGYVYLLSKHTEPKKPKKDVAMSSADGEHGLDGEAQSYAIQDDGQQQTEYVR